MHRQQRGVTAIGWILLLVPIAIVGYAAIRLTPIYLNYMKVVRGLEQLSSSTSASDAGSARSVRLALEKYFDIDGVDFPKVDDISVTRDQGRWIVQAAYDDEAPLFANISIQVSFDKTVTLE